MSSNQMNNRPSLLVYKASAGSGKTFTLAVEYIKYLIECPRAYEGILAVTFTNKATEEMKMRILSQLYGLSHNLPDSKDYMDVLKADTGLEEDTIAKCAGEALHLMLHNYHYFKVQTIDKFFQAILHNLAHELQLNSKLHSDINNNVVVDNAVNELIDTLDANSPVLGTIMGFINEKLDDDKSWDVIKPLKHFGNNIFTEIYKSNRRKFDKAFEDPGFFTSYRKELNNIRTTIYARYQEYGKKALRIIADEGLTLDDFKGKKNGVVSYFKKLEEGLFYNEEKILTKTFLSALESPKLWALDKSPHAEKIVRMAEDTLIPLVSEIESSRQVDSIMYNSAVQTLKQLNNTQLLRDIEIKAREMNDDAQRFMLSDTQNLLHDMIGDSDAPFIFEKLGARLKHVMIDEFQDTSVVQWANFKVLLKQCMSEELTNLIVGDVKQSIYRFRSGDWRLLNNIDKEFMPGEIGFDGRKNYNYRSLPNIIHFNNYFFRQLVNIESADLLKYDEGKALQLKNAYADVEQVPSKKGKDGLVHIEMLSSNLLHTMEKRVLATIFGLLEQENIQQKDICILVRKNKSIPLIAKYIEEETQGEIKVVSDEAFRLDASHAVNIIIRCMMVLANPKDDLSFAIIRNECGGEIPKEFIQNQESFAALPLYEMAEEILRIFNLGQLYDEGAYLTVFFDTLHDFCNSMMPVLRDFLAAWDDEFHEKTIEIGDVNGVRITTIHKSKGLEYPHVIIPYCNWIFNEKASLVWAEPDVEPFNRLPLVALDYYNVSTFEHTIYKTQGYDEHIQTVVENLNFLYVAFTRAEKSLFVIGEQSQPSQKKIKRSTAILQILQNLPSEIEGMPVHVDEIQETGQDGKEGQVLSVTYGSLYMEEKHAKKKTKNIFLASSKHTKVEIASYSNRTQFRESNKSREFAEDTTDEKDRLRIIRRGTVLHQLFANINTLDDIKSALMRMEFDGTLFDSDTTKEDIVNELNSKFQNATVRSWFDPHWTVLNERTILIPGEEAATVRPDRVITDGNETIVIDFKFGTPFKDYAQQVQYYMEKLQEMNMPNVKGFLWYVTRNEIVPVGC